MNAGLGCAQMNIIDALAELGRMVATYWLLTVFLPLLLGAVASLACLGLLIRRWRDNRAKRD
jgi:predicted exporter